MTENDRARLNNEIQQAIQTEYQCNIALPAINWFGAPSINWIDILTKLAPIIIDILKTHSTPK